jgi:hypothetical protein
MRPQQQNRRMRGRNNNRKSPNPLTRNYESNGPDVKIRGSAQQVADKYAALARDAQSSGDRVMAENYLQHAEHYNRIIAAAAAQAQAQREYREDREDRDDSDSDSHDRHRQHREQAPSREPANDGSGPQPVIEGTPAEVALGEQPSQPHKRRGRKATNGGTDAKDQESSAESGNEDSASETPRKKPIRRSRKTTTSGDNKSDQSAEKDGPESDNAVAAAAGE